MSETRSLSTTDVIAAFDDAAESYDTAGPQFQGPVAARLVELAGLQPGWHVLDLGCGPGTALLRAARAVAPNGRAHGVDLAPGMLARAYRDAGDAGLGEVVTLTCGDAADPPVTDATYHAVLASLVLYLLPDPAAALARWRELLLPGGTLAISRGVGPDPRWAATFSALDAYAPTTPAWQQLTRRLGTLEDTTAMLAACGYRHIISTVETVTVRYDSPEQWWEASFAEGPRVTWQGIPPDQLQQARSEAIASASQLRGPDGSLYRHIRIAYIIARAS